MLSKMLPWDFIQKHPLTIQKNKCGIYAFLIDDPFLEREILSRVPKHEIPMSLYSGNEFTRDFVEEHFINLSFFTNIDHIQVMNAENCPAETMTTLLESDIDWSERYLLLFFTKSNKQFIELSKNAKVEAYEVEQPRFWESAKMWQFCQSVRGLNFDSSVSKFVLENLEHNFESFFWIIDVIGMNFPDMSEKKIDLKLLTELVKKERWDFFELMEVFNRNPSLFFLEVLKKDLDFEWMRAMSAMMQTHLVKMLFPEEILAKPKPSKYDQSIIETSRRFDRSVLKNYLRFFSELEILAKSSDQLLINKLRLMVLK